MGTLIWYSRNVLNIKMNNAGLNCHKCSTMFSNFKHLAQHSRISHNIELKEEKEETMDPLAAKDEPIKNLEGQVINLDETEKETKEMLKDINAFMKTQDSAFIDLDEKVAESQKQVLNVMNNSMESIEIMDSDEEDTVKKPDPIRPPVPLPRNQTMSFKAPKPPPLRPTPIPTSTFRRAGHLMTGKFKPTQCVYCGKNHAEKISLARHLIGEHWEAVRNAQGGGKRDNSAYYASIEDSRIIRPDPKAVKPSNSVPKPPGYSATAQKHAKNLAAAQAANAKYNMNQNPKWLDKLGGKGSSENINRKLRNVHNPSWFGGVPNRKLLPKQMMPEVPSDMSFDLTNDPDACDVCDDDFNWPDASHVCKRTQKKQSQSVAGMDKKVLQEIPVKSTRNILPKIPISATTKVPITPSGADLKNLVKNLSSKSGNLKITPVVKKR